MKGKKSIITFMSLVSLFIVCLPTIFGVYYNLNRIFNIMQYEEVCKEFDNISDSILYDEKTKNNFLEKTNGVFGILYIEDLNLKQPIYYSEFNNCSKNNFLVGDAIEGNIFIYINNQYFSEGNFNKLIDIDNGVEIVFNIFGKSKKFVIDDTKTVSTFNKKISKINSNKKLNILIGMPFGINAYRYLIKARYLNDVVKSDTDIFSELIFSNYLFLIFIILILMVTVLFIIFLCRVVLLFKSENKLIRKKYKPKIYNFE